MSRLDQILTWIENGVAGFALGGAAILAIAQVILRYVFNYIIFWGEEAMIYLIILATFVGATITLRHKEHVGVDILSLLVGDRGKRVLTMLSALLIALYCGILGALGWIMITEPAAWNIVTVALKLPLAVVQISLPIGLTLMFIRALEILYRAARGRETFPEAEEHEPGEGTV